MSNGNEETRAELDDSKKELAQEWTDATVLIPEYKTKQINSMYIRFVSGTSDSKDDIIVFPPFANLSKGESVGSQLYIDDVELIYDYE